MTLLGKMDRLVYATRLDRIVFMTIRPRAFRWTPLFVGAALVIGYAQMARTASAPTRSYLIGWIIFYGAFLAATFLRTFGPRFTGTTRSPVDERELMVKFRAFAVSGIVLASFAMLGCFYMASAGIWGLWRPRALDWVNLGFGFQAGGMLLPTLVASWMQPRSTADFDD